MNAADRRHYLGGSDAAVVLGVSSWKSPVELWQEKALGKVKPVSEAVRRARRRGTKLEPYIRDMVIEKLADEGHDVELVACNERYVDPSYPFLSVEIDFELKVDGELVNVDAKSANRHMRDAWGKTGTDEMPIEYVAQFMAGLGITPGNRRRTLVGALRSFDDVDLYELTRDDETIAAMREKMVRFWNDHVLTKVPPDPRDFADVRSLFPKAKPKSIAATPEVLTMTERLKRISIEEATLTAEQDEIKFQLAKFMGNAALLTNGVRDVLSWDNQVTMRFDLAAFKREHPDWVALYTKSTTSRVMRFASKRG